MERFRKDLKKHGTKRISYEKREIIPLTQKENKSYKKQKIVTYANKDLVLMMTVKNINSEITVIILELLIIFVI